jgi:hypothetical protein
LTLSARAQRRSIAALVAAVAFVSPGAAAANGGSMEYAVKAAYLYKFAPFVQWPPLAFASPSSPFQLCILGKDPFGASLDQAVNGQTVDGHPVQVRRLPQVNAGSGCHIVFLGASRSQTQTDALRALRGAPVLTVTDSDVSGAIIRFVVQDNRVRFNIDATAAATNRVTLSSKLLSLALSVRAGG